MATYCVFTRPEAPKFAKLVLWLLDLPRKGIHIGSGIHVANDLAPPNPCPRDWPGYTTRHVRWIAKPSNVGPPPPAPGPDTDEFAFRVTAKLAVAWQAKKDQLTPAQRLFVQSHLDSAADLAAAWQVGGVLRETEDVEPEP